MDTTLHSYSTIFKAIDKLNPKLLWLPYLLAAYLPRPQQRPFWLLMLDVTPCPHFGSITQL